MNKPTIHYDISQPFIEYHNNLEYRQWIRTVFRTDKEKIKQEIESVYDNVSSLEEETLDELCIDMDAMEETMSKLFILTESHELFQKLYDAAAAKMISTDRTIGQCVLFSYDYFYLFHACMCVFLTNPSQFTIMCPYYVDLKKKLTTK